MITLTPCWFNNDNSNHSHDLDVYVLSEGEYTISTFQKNFYGPIQNFFSKYVYKRLLKNCSQSQPQTVIVL